MTHSDSFGSSSGKSVEDAAYGGEDQLAEGQHDRRNPVQGADHSFRRTDSSRDDAQAPLDQLTRLKTNHSTSGQSVLDPETVSRVATLARTLSNHRARDGSLEVDTENFDAEQIIRSFVCDSKEQGIHLRKAGIIAENFTVVGQDCSSAEGQTFEDILLLPRTIFRGIRAAKNAKTRDIVREANMLARPGEMILVLGRPGAGCSSFLKTIAGETTKFKEIHGSISYDGIPQAEMMRKYKTDVVYNGEIDVHFPHLTVQQTLDFALACTTPKVRVNGISRSEYIATMRELYATIFGLRHTYNTKVGNDFVRGVSGGERKRVSIAEALAARGSIYCWDNATRGLDASTALEFAQALRLMTNLQKSVALVTIYQASENIFDCFDRVTLLYDGRQIYFGDVDNAEKYFEKLGYLRPARQSTPEFLTALTDPKGLHEFVPGMENKAPRTAEEFEQRWRDSSEFQSLLREVETYKNEITADHTKELYDKSLSQEKSSMTRSKSAYTVSFLEQVRLCTQRGFQRIYGDKAFTVTNIIASIIQGLVTGSLYYSLPSGVSGAFSRGGVFYFAILYTSLMGLAKISLDSRPIVEKHKTYSLYHPAAEAFASSVSEFPFRFISQTCFYILIFFLSGMTREAGRFFTSFLFLIICAESINALFDLITAMSSSVSQANSIAGTTLMALVLYSTYMIQLAEMHPWFKWISYAIPIRYTFESMLNSEFHGRKMDCTGNVIPVGSSYSDISSRNQVCAFSGSRPGQSYVVGDDYLSTKFEYKYTHTWRNLGILFAFVVFYLFAKCIITELRPSSSGGGDTLVFKKGAKRLRSQPDEENGEKSLTMPEAKKNVERGSLASSSDSSNFFEGLKSEGAFLWKNVSYTIPYKGSTRKLLDDVSGYCVPGTLTALMGESGAGKTTLLNTLAQRNVGIITGDMLVNGNPIDASFERRTGYVQQQDVHVKEMTVRESLQFSARLRRPQSVPDAEKLEYVERIIEVLDMEEYAEALVGDVGYGLNVEQRKKLSIGVELAAKPDLLLFLDEPTSGLDSQSSWAIVQLLRKLAEAGQSILCTIHQPSATLFEQFDRLLLLKKGGQTVYFGPVGKNSQNLLEYFQENGARKCEKSENPAEYILEAIGAGATASVKEDWHVIWKNSHQRSKADKELDDFLKKFNSTQSNTEGNQISKYATSYSYQFKVVYARNAAVFWRDVNYLMAKLMLHLCAGLFIGFTFYNVGTSYAGLQNAMFAAFMALIISAPAMNQIQARAIASRELFEVRESKSNTFHWMFLVLSQYLCELPYQLVFSTVFFVGFYFPLRVHYEARYAGVFFLNYCIMFQLYFVGLGLMLLYAAPNLASAGVMLSLSLSFLISFCGVVQPASLMPGFWTFMWKASPYTYFVQNTVGIVLHDKPVICRAKEMSYLNPPSGQTCGEFLKDFLAMATGYVENPNATENCGYCLFTVGDDYLNQISSSYSHIWRNFGFFWVYICFNIVGMVALYYIFHVSSFSLKDTRVGKTIMGKLKAEEK
ncbi:LADA_0A07316g1_1 [Lachancea dasiensis]|uniref:LADA_0A07316g1_1 n=1 Tax=Lachancea dasiensis TaxID=1072105 RepID=A0A1G4IQH6_9SACH|nr:LADA_0A07316g1_1 [Lachancea dasiensis]